MIANALILVLCANVARAKMCYWNDFCPYQLFGTKTPYDAVRGDIREYPDPDKCEAVSVWALIRHGHRYAKETEVESMRAVAKLKDDIVASYHSGNSQLCAQDIENLINWNWLDNFQPSALSALGHAELVSLGGRLQQKYAHSEGDEVYIRATNRERTEASSKAFLQGLTEKDKGRLWVGVHGPWGKDDVIKPYEDCNKYLERLQMSEAVNEQLNAFDGSEEYVAVIRNVQRRLGIARQLSAEDVNNLYELCRSSRLWDRGSLRSAWCAMFSEQDLLLLEYREDVKRYYKNGYGIEESVGLGSLSLRDLYEKMEAAYYGHGKKLVAYFSHKTLMEMVVSALGLFKDNSTLEGSKMKSSRLWRSSEISCSSSNLMVILLRCDDNGMQTHRVQIFLNEKPTDLCPLEGCTWQRFQELFLPYTSANLAFCKSQQHQQMADNATQLGLKTMSMVLVFVLFIAYNKERFPFIYKETSSG